MTVLLEVKSLQKVYTTRFGGNSVTALSNVNFSVEKGEYIAIMGESGSGTVSYTHLREERPSVSVRISSLHRVQRVQRHSRRGVSDRMDVDIEIQRIDFLAEFCHCSRLPYRITGVIPVSYTHLQQVMSRF